MIDHCDSSFLHRRFDAERLPLSHQLTAPGAGSPSSILNPQSSPVRSQIARRDQSWAELKLFQVPSAIAVSSLRVRNDAVVKMLAASPRPFSSELTHVEILLCKLCEIFCARCELEILAETRRPGVVGLIRHSSFVIPIMSVQIEVHLLRPFVYLRFRERAGRKVWMPQETHYLSNF